MNTVLVVALSLLAAVVSAGPYELSMTRVKRDVYRIDKSALYVRTKDCEVRIWRTKATLQFTAGAKSRDSLTFADGSSCRVISVVEWTVPLRRIE